MRRFSSAREAVLCGVLHAYTSRPAVTVATPAAFVHEKHCVVWSWQKKRKENPKTRTSCTPFMTAEVTAPTRSSMWKKAHACTALFRVRAE